MMSNVVPVCSRTGFGPDLIEHGHNGFLFDVDAPIEIIYDLVEQAFDLETNIRATVQDRTWQSFSADIRAIAENLG
jgi:glycosyltransferase involved in cell wall biosynthesis